MFTHSSTPSGPRPRKNQWRMRQFDKGAARQLAESYSLHEVVAQILSSRGWTSPSEAVFAFLNPQLRSLRDPFELRSMDAAVDRVAKAVEAKEEVCVYGDYDVDGVTSSVLMTEVLRFAGLDPKVIIPHRIRDGYGMSLKHLEGLASAGCSLIVTVDTGITAIEEVIKAKQLGMDVVVTDHHQQGAVLPDASAVVNPNRTDAHYEFGRLCGVGVAFKFAHALLKRLSIDEASAKSFLLNELDLVALGTIADVVPLEGENRIFVKHGLNRLVKSERPGIQELLAVSGCAERGVSPETVGFALGPRLNAAGRTDDAMLAFKLLITRDRQEAIKLAAHLDRLNIDRRSIEAEILQASKELAEDHLSKNADSYTLVVSGQGWHLGVVGIVAARLVEAYDIPAVVLSEDLDVAKGSARSIPQYSIYDALAACDSHLDRWGGHDAAAGLTIKVTSLPQFREAMNEHAKDIFESRDITRIIDVDAEVSGPEITWQLYDDLQKLQPFGEGNPVPLLCLRNASSASSPRIVGKNHLKARVRHQGAYFDVIGFGKGQLLELFECGNSIDLLVRPSENNFNGKTSLQLELEDARISK